MHRETPFIASLLRELRERDLLPESPPDRYPPVEPSSLSLHAIFYLLQEIGQLPVRFRFKGAVSPYSRDLAEVLEEYNYNRGLWAREAERGRLSESSHAALERLARVAADVPQAFVNSPADRERWWFVLATYVFIAKSPLYAGDGEKLIQAVREHLPEAFDDAELRAAADRLTELAA